MIRQETFKFIPGSTRALHRFLSGNSTGPDGGDEKGTVEKLVEFFKRADESVSKQEDSKLATSSSVDTAMEKTEHSKPAKFESRETRERTGKSSAPHYVPWTIGRFLQPESIKKMKSRRDSSHDQTFASLLRHSPFIQLGDFQSREVLGVVIENVNDTDLYIDYGGKFHCVCPNPPGSSYPRGSLVRIRLRDPEMTNRFMINTKGISLCEADGVLLGPYRGRVQRGLADSPPADPSKSANSTENDFITTDSWQLL